MESFKDLILLKLVQSQCALIEDFANFANLLKIHEERGWWNIFTESL